MGQRGERPVEGQGGPFGILDSRLTIFALANGMDLEKDADTRTLRWYRDGWERGILLAPTPGGEISVTPMAWQPGESAPPRRTGEVTRLDEADPVREIGAVLEAALEAANAL